MIDIDEPVYFTAPDGQRYRITIHFDTDTDSPRTWTNITVMHTFDSRWNSPDGSVCQDRRHRQVHSIIPSDYVTTDTVGLPVDMRRARRYETLFDADCLAIAGLHRGQDGTLSLDYDGDEADGYCMITTASWEECMGDAEFTPDTAREMMESDVKIYNKWASGEFTAFEVEQELNWQALDADGNLVEDRTMTTWDTTEYVGGFDDADAAFEQAVDMLPEGSDRED